MRGRVGARRAAVPVAAMVLGMAGLIPFVWAVLALQTGRFVLPGLTPRFVANGYGLMIFCYMAGCFWPFAARLGGWFNHGLSVAPVLALIAALILEPASLTLALMAGFAALLPIDWYFQWRGAAPGWWMRLRLPLSAVVIACLAAIYMTAPRP
ncbi:DUF3429 domain-containing protein [Paracoccus jeotgali]|uniref:DUF3429 domain-containing protein n=1 Tax=Paracoccus jeotgali TaxID=2065379 RepID=A0A2K9MFG1_9RHOB|nr:DUF3429 domain-containing protein [Paracoccus jeotgali]AUM74350.1 DUF3429 domain-containing protein [Paracoccus jeotgali]